MIATAIGSGRASTAAIVEWNSGDSIYNNAAKAASAYRGPNNLADWFLPNMEELNELYRQRSSFGILSGTFWSSLQSSLSAAYSKDFSTGIQTPTNKSNIFNVRPIRAF